jgi:predicted phage terminase large subunit-like protein
MAIDIAWKLLPWQIEVWQDKSRFKVIAAGRRCGKSNLAIKMLLAKALEAPEGSAVVYVAPTLGQARQIAWDALLTQGRSVIKQAHVNQMDITLVTGRKIHIRSGENPDTLRGLKLYFAVIDEAAFVKEDLFTKIIRPALADLKGEAVLISTPDGRNWFYDAYKTGESGRSKDWKSWHLTTLDNPTIDPEEIEAAKKTLSTFHFNQEFLASFTNSGTGLFKEEWLKYGTEPADGSWYIAIDLAGFKEVNNATSAADKRLDQSAICVVKATDDGTWFVEKIEYGRWDIDSTAMRILKNVKEYQPVAVGLEKGMARQAVLGPLEKLMREYNTYFHIMELTHGNQRKTDRIMWSLQGNFEHGRIILNKEEKWTEFIDQYLMFPSTQVHDDLVDALSYVSQVATTVSTDDYDEEDWTPMDVESAY